jgi:hypothetical protein
MKASFKRSNLRGEVPKPYKSVLPKPSTTHKRTHSLHFEAKKSILKKSSGTPESHHRTMSSNKSATPDSEQPSKYSNTESDPADREVSAIWDFISQRSGSKAKASISELRENMEQITISKLQQTSRLLEQQAKTKRLLLERFKIRSAESEITPRSGTLEKTESLDTSQRLESTCSEVTESYRECLRLVV